MQKLKIAYFGTPDFSAVFLEKLLTDKDIPVEVVLVVTQPDRPVGRKMVKTPSPVKEFAKRHSLKIATLLHGKIVGENNVTIEQCDNADLALVYAFGHIIPKQLLEVPPHGFWNIHPSLLPKYRGPSPIATPIIQGDAETGVTLIEMDEEMDHGPIIAQQKVVIASHDRRPDMEKKLTKVGYEMFKKTINVLFSDHSNRGRDSNGIQLTEQNHSETTYTKKLTKETGFLEIVNLKSLIINQPEKVFNLFRGLYPWPGIWSKVRIKNKPHFARTFAKAPALKKASRGREVRIKITDMDLVGDKLVIKKVQLEGKNEVDFKTFRRAYGW